MLAELLLVTVSGCNYLWGQQDADGAWRSKTYGLLKSGYSLTPFVLNTLLDVCPAKPEAAERAISFITNSPREEYATYGTALAVLALSKAKRDTGPMVKWLLTQQFANGAWGMGKHVDLSMTRYVLQALVAAGLPRDHEAFQKARAFVESCQNPDGGFLFSSVIIGANKAGPGKSYGSATADGILSLEALGLPSDRARQWLEKNGMGIEGKWAEGLQFYFAAASMEALGYYKVTLPPQHPDGSWSNPETLVKEDDPLIATTFALKAWQNKGR